MAMTPPPPPPPTPAAAPVGSSQYSPWASRVIATLVRSVASAIVYIPAAVVALILGKIWGPLGALAILAGVVGIIAVAIRAMIQRGHLGYDFGDRVANQTLIKEQTDAPMGSGMEVFVRGIVHIVDGLPFYIGYLWPLWDEKRQTFADKILSTTVVSGRPQPHEAKDLLINALQIWVPVTKN
ncbi:MAG: hypothetical protein CSA55_03505 [Ilumatobacter coccineus]|uniref:RDD domain-containing protein n=1 Tax=Ilumatobacter coccineus TaxID=467094 RepID=A0A2G6K9K4_9ACTN|nr:MAG: hypothetical protein CSA55_03505 [Ilumatobacter coccineus]